MKMRGKALLLMAMLCLGGCSNMDHLPSRLDGYYLSKKQVSELSIKARHGDAKSSERLGYYYLVYEGNEKNGVFWLNRAVQQGSRSAKISLESYFHAKSERPKETGSP